MSTFSQILSYLPRGKIPVEGFNEAWYFKIAHDFGRNLPPYDKRINHYKLDKSRKKKADNSYYNLLRSLVKLSPSNETYYDWLLVGIPFTTLVAPYTEENYGLWVFCDVLISHNKAFLRSFIRAALANPSWCEDSGSIFRYFDIILFGNIDNPDLIEQILSRYEEIVERIPTYLESFDVPPEDSDYLYEKLTSFEEVRKLAVQHDRTFLVDYFGRLENFVKNLLR